MSAARTNIQHPTSNIGQLFPAPHAVARQQYDRAHGYNRVHCTCGWRSAWYAIAADALAAAQRHLEDRP
jgi:hypothetical protein